MFHGFLCGCGLLQCDGTDRMEYSAINRSSVIQEFSAHLLDEILPGLVEWW